MSNLHATEFPDDLIRAAASPTEDLLDRFGWTPDLFDFEDPASPAPSSPSPAANATPTIKSVEEVLYDLSDEYTRKEARAIARSVVRGYDADRGAETIARHLVRELGLDRHQAQVVATTELTRVAAADVLSGAGKVGARKVRFTNVGDSCPVCRGLQGRVYSVRKAQDVVPVHPGCNCRWEVVEGAGIENAFCPTGKGGGVDPSCGKGGAGGVKIKTSKTRAFEGAPVPTRKISKQEAGRIGEEIAIAHLKSMGKADAKHMNLDRNNFPIDLVQDHKVIEVKTGQVSNGPKAQQWRLTIGEPGKAEKDWLAKAGKEEKADWNARKQKMIHKRKAAALKDLSKKVGRPVKARTVTVLLDPDKKVADIYEFDGWHDRIGWNSDQAKSGYVRSVKYG